MTINENWPYLSEEKADSLAREGKKNDYTVKGTNSRKNIWITNLFTYYNMLNIFLAVLIATTGVYRNMFFIVIVAANFFLGTIQELRAKRALESLSVLSSPKSRVVRDRREKTVSSSDLVLGDLIILGAGDQIMADGDIIDGEIRINESLITGESDPVVRCRGETVKSGSYVISGEAAVKLTAVGKDSFAEKIALEGRKQKSSGSILKRTMKDIIKVISFFIVPLGIVTFISHYFTQGLGYGESMVSTVAAMVGMIPDGLYLLTSVSFAAGVIRLAKKRTLVQQMYSLESLARVDVLCLDKTGTITTGKMKVRSVEKLCENDTETILSEIYSAVPADNETAKAVVQRFGIPENPVKAVHFMPFTSETKFVAADFEAGGCYMFGAPEYVMKTGFETEREKAEKLECDGSRVLVLAMAERKGNEYIPYKILSFILIEDEIRENAKETFAFFGENDVSLRVISGDSAAAVSAIAKKAGIPGAEKYADITGFTDEEIRSIVSDTVVFGRVNPEQKRTIIRELKNLGHKVAMTGDGVNDVLALKEADCSVAMANGAGAASHASQIVLVDSDFCAMPDVVNEGRRVINNIQRSAPLFLMKTMYSFGITLIVLLFGSGYPFEPIQLTFIGLIASAVPGLIMSMENSFERVGDNFIRDVVSRALSGALAIFAGITAILVFSEHFTVSGDQTASMAVIFTGFSSLVTLYISCMPPDGYKKAAIVASVLFFAAGIAFLGDIFMLVPLDTAETVLTVILCALSPAQYYFGRKMLWMKKEK